MACLIRCPTCGENYNCKVERHICMGAKDVKEGK